MGVTIWHRGGPVDRKTVERIVGQLKEQLRREGYSDETGTQRACERCFWVVDEPVSQREKEMLERRKLSKERESAEMMASILEQEGDTEGAKRIREKFEEEKDVYLPDGFEPEHVKGVCANLHPKAETFCVLFYKNDGKDEWRDPLDFTKTQFSPEGVHVEICEYLEDVKRKVEDAGGKYLIHDEGNYCDSRHPTKDPKELEKRMKGNWAIINMVTEALTGEKRPDVEVVLEENVPKDNPGEPRGQCSLDEWMALRDADLLVSIRPKKPIGVLRIVKPTK